MRNPIPIGFLSVISLRFICSSAEAQCNLSSLNVPRYGMAVTRSCGGDIFAIGGIDASGNISATVERLSAFSGSWQQVNDFIEPRSNAAAASAGNFIYLFGGEIQGSGVSGSIHRAWVSLGSLNWQPFPCGLPSPRWGHTAVSYADKIYVMGGTTNGSNLFPDCIVIDPSTGLCTQTNPMPIPVFGHAAAELGGFIYVFAGAPSSSAFYNYVHRFDSSTNTWSILPTALLNPPYNVGVGRLKAVSTSSSIILSGGGSLLANNCNASIDLIAEFIPAAIPCVNGGIFRVVRSTCVARDNHGSAYLVAGAFGCASGIVSFGGCSGTNVLGSTECLPASGLPPIQPRPCGICGGQIQNYCTGSRGAFGCTPVISSGLSSQPCIGGGIVVQSGNALGNTGGFLLFGFSSASITIFPGITLCVMPFQFDTIQTSLPGIPCLGFASKPYHIPYDSTLVGLEVFFQAFFFDPFVPPYYLSATNGLKMTIG